MSIQAFRSAGIVRLAERVVRCYFEHRMATYAAALAYRGLFPFSSERVPDQLKPGVEQGKGHMEPLEKMVEQAEKQAGGDLLIFGLAAALWGVSAVANTLADYGVTYGSLGAAVGLLVYLDLSASIVLAGAELNAAIHHSAADRTTGAKTSEQERDIPPT